MKRYYSATLRGEECIKRESLTFNLQNSELLADHFGLITGEHSCTVTHTAPGTVHTHLQSALVGAVPSHKTNGIVSTVGDLGGCICIMQSTNLYGKSLTVPLHFVVISFSLLQTLLLLFSIRLCMSYLDRLLQHCDESRFLIHSWSEHSP